jgi:penicillin-binding protein 1A
VTLSGIFGTLVRLLLCALASCTFALTLSFAFAWNTLPHAVPVPAGQLAQNSRFFDASGRLIGIVEGEENRYPISLARTGAWTADATVAIEDQRFWGHDGYDARGIGRSVWRNVAAGQAMEGASTITQQLVRTEQPQIYQMDPWQRKVYEIQASRALEADLAARHGRDKAKRIILERYLNAVYYGHGAYGIEAAARTFFSKGAYDLTLAESAMLAGLIQSPTRYDPFTSTGRRLAYARQHQVLAAMRREGWISAAQQEAATGAKLKLGKMGQVRRMPYVQDQMRLQIERWYGDKALDQGGLRVWTTIRPRAQQQAEQALRDHLDREGYPAGALVSIDNATGQIVAMASTGVYRRSQFNLASQARRQPGSSAKVWALAALVDRGVDPRKLQYESMPIEVRRVQDAGRWKPETYDGSYPGWMSLESALIRSDNSVFAQLALDVGPHEVARAADLWGIERDLLDVPSIVLGSQEVSVLEQTNFYSTIAREGLRVEPTLIRRLQSNTAGDVAVPRIASQRVAPAGRVRVIQQWLKENVERGTGTAAQLYGRDVAGKTGTTDEYKDAWFCGFTVQLTTCVWVGYVTPRPMLDVGGRRISGGTLPAEIWRAYNQRYHERLPALDFKQPASGKDVWPAELDAGGWKSDPNLEIFQPFYKPPNSG